jgi:hypothetical protein
MIDYHTEYIDSEKTVNHRCVAYHQFPAPDSQKRSVILPQGTDPSRPRLSIQVLSRIPNRPNSYVGTGSRPRLSAAASLRWTCAIPQPQINKRQNARVAEVKLLNRERFLKEVAPKIAA